MLADGRGRLLVLVASVAVSAVMLYDQSTDDRSAAILKDQSPAPTSAPSPDAAAAPDLIAASAPVANQAAGFALPVGVAPEQGLQVHTIWVARAISVLFPEINTIGGARPDALKWHPNGLAIDPRSPTAIASASAISPIARLLKAQVSPSCIIESSSGRSPIGAASRGST